MSKDIPTTVLPAKAGIQLFGIIQSWIPAFAGMTVISRNEP